jgi:hypothetical protein
LASKVLQESAGIGESGENPKYPWSCIETVASVRGAMLEKKHIAYCYDGETRDEDTVFDPDGTVLLPDKGTVIRMHGQNWRVTYVARTLPDKEGFVAYRIYLARA